MENLPKKLKNLVESFQRFPGIGYKTAERLSFNLLEMNEKYIDDFANSILKSKEIKKCEKCNNISDNNICNICMDEKRDQDIICVVGDVKDLLAIEKSSSYNGLYFVLNKLISPSKGFLPNDLNIDILIKRISKLGEIILALNTSIEGETTSLFLRDLFKSYDIKVTTLGYGLPMGSNIEYSDEITIAKSFENRKESKK